MQKWISWALSGLFRYLNAIQTMCPHILRYLTTAVITNKDVRKRRQVLKDLVKVIQQVRTEICCFLFIFFFFYWDYNFNVPVLGLLTYFSPNSVTEFFVHCEVKCVLFAGRAKWMKYNVLSVLLFFFPPVWSRQKISARSLELFSIWFFFSHPYKELLCKCCTSLACISGQLNSVPCFMFKFICIS